MSELSAYCDGFKAALAAAEAGIERREIRAFLNTRLREWSLEGGDIGREAAPQIQAGAEDSFWFGDAALARPTRRR